MNPPDSSATAATLDVDATALLVSLKTELDGIGDRPTPARAQSGLKPSLPAGAPKIISGGRKQGLETDGTASETLSGVSAGFPLQDTSGPTKLIKNYSIPLDQRVVGAAGGGEEAIKCGMQLSLDQLVAVVEAAAAAGVRRALRQEATSGLPMTAAMAAAVPREVFADVDDPEAEDTSPVLLQHSLPRSTLSKGKASSVDGDGEKRHVRAAVGNRRKNSTQLGRRASQANILAITRGLGVETLASGVDSGERSALMRRNVDGQTRTMGTIKAAAKSHESFEDLQPYTSSAGSDKVRFRSIRAMMIRWAN